jgi:hypothetical protein
MKRAKPYEDGVPDNERELLFTDASGHNVLFKDDTFRPISEFSDEFELNGLMSGWGVVVARGVHEALDTAMKPRERKINALPVNVEIVRSLIRSREFEK